MNKLISKIVGVALGLTLAVGTGVAIGASGQKVAKANAANTDSITITYGGFEGSPAYNSGAEYTGSFSDSSSNSITVACKYVMANNGNMQAQANNANIYNKTALPGRLVSVVLTQTGTARAFSCYGGTSQLFDSSETGTGKTPSGTSLGNVSSAATMTWNAPSNTNYTFFAIHKGANAGYVTNIVVTYEVSGVVTPTLETPEPVFDSANLEVSWEDVDNATSYQYKIDNGEYDDCTSPVDVSSVAEGSHTFSVIAKASGYNDSEAGTCNILIPSADGYLPATMAAGTNGYTGYTVNGKEAIKVGTNSSGGSMTITVPAGATKLRFYAAAWNGVSDLSLNATPANKLLTTSFALTADSGVSGSSTDYTLNGSESSYKFNEIILSNISEQTTITLTSSIAKRFVVWGAAYSTQATSVVNVTDVAISSVTASISVGGQTTLTATVYPTNATVQDVTWTSSDTNVATVSGGVVTGIDAGTATITVTTVDGEFSDDCVVTVTAPTSTNTDVAGAIQVINGLNDAETTTGYYKVTGYVVAITYLYSASSGDMTFTIADTKGGSPVLTCYKVKCSSAVAATILKDAKISLVGNLKKFVKDNTTTPELVNSLPSQITILEAGTPIQTYVVTFAEALQVLGGLQSGERTYDKYTVTGIVNSITNAYSGGKISFEIGATENATDKIKVYNLVLSAEDAAKVEVGATIRVTGNLELYGSTNELTNGESFELISAPIHEVKEVYDLDFLYAGESDSTSSLSTSNWSTVIKGDASELSCTAIDKVYGGANNTIKFNSSSAKGSITLKATDASIKRVIICAKTYISVGEGGVETPDTGGIIVNSSATQSVDESWKYYTFDLATASDEVKIEGSKASKGRFYVKDIIFIDESAQDAIDAYGFAATFMNSTSAECEATNVTSSTWSTLSGNWTTLSSDAKEYIGDKSANKTGNLVEEMLARYEIIVKGYSYTNFMSRTIGAHAMNGLTMNNNALIIVVITMFVTGTFVGGYFFLRKKKEN